MILLNYLMPGPNGVEVIPMLRKLPELKGIKIIIHSAAPWARAESLAAGADGFLLKPFNQAQALAEVVRVLRPPTTPS